MFALDGTYHTPKLDTLFEEFKKHILQLTIDDSERKSIKIEQVQKEKSKVEAENADIGNLKEQYNLDHQLLQVLAYSLSGAGIQLVKPNGDSYKINHEFVKETMQSYVVKHKPDLSLKDIQVSCENNF